MKINIKLLFICLTVLNSISCKELSDKNKEISTVDKVITNESRVSEKIGIKRKLSQTELDLLEDLEQYYSSPKQNGYGIIDEFYCPSFEGCLNDSLEIDNKGYLHYVGKSDNPFIDSYRLLTDYNKPLENGEDNFTITYSRGGQISYTYEIQHYGGKWICIKTLNDYYGNFELEIWVNHHKIYSESKTSSSLE